MSENSLFTNEGIEIPIFTKSIDYFLNRSVILYGSSNSGKSTIIKDILYMLKDHIPNICVICPTNSLNKSYDDIVPKQLIHSEVSENLIKDILKRQDISVKMYNMANNFDKLKSIYKGLFKKNESKLSKINNTYTSIKNKLENNNNIHFSEKKINLNELENMHKKRLLKFYQTEITNNLKYINKCNIDDSDKLIMKHININPNFLLIIDDAAVSASVWCRYREIKELFFNGRHHRITFMIAFQDDKLLESSLRKNAFINIFTTEKVCNSFFERSTNGFTRAEKKRMSEISETVFNDKKLGTKNYKKIVYLKDSLPTSYYMIADCVDDFMFGSDYLIEYCDKIKKGDDAMSILEFDSYFD